MTYINNTNNYNMRFAAQNSLAKDSTAFITKPIDQVENLVTKTVDTFVPESKDEETKKSHKTAIRVGSTVLVLSAFVALFNPKFSSAMMKRLKETSTKAGDNAKLDKSLKGKLNKLKQKGTEYINNVIQIMNNANSAKDTGFKYLCDKFSFLKKPHQAITKGFDKISKRTVFSKYSNAESKMNELENLINLHRDKLSSEEIRLLDRKLEEIRNLRMYFGSEEVGKRLANQENLMTNLEKDVISKIKSYTKGFDFREGKGAANKLEHAKGSFTFWAEEALMSSRNALEAEGKTATAKLIGDGKTAKGAYNELFDIIAPHLKEEEKSVLEKQILKTGKKLRGANNSECVEYFDKKRDLVLGSAPTDVVSALFFLGAGGVAVGTAHSKEDRISRTITGVFPVVAGLGVSTALTAMLFSGGKGMAIGSAASTLLSLIGSTVNRFIFPKNKEEGLNSAA